MSCVVDGGDCQSKDDKQKAEIKQLESEGQANSAAGMTNKKRGVIPPMEAESGNKVVVYNG